MMDPEMVVPIHDELRKNGVHLALGDGIQEVLVDSSGSATGVRLRSGQVLEGSIVILGLGVRPNNQLAVAAGLAIGKTGGLLTNSSFQTSDSDIYAVGDVAEYLYGPTGESMRVPLAGPANRAGRLAGEHAATDTAPSAVPVLGTAIVRVFEITAAMTGLSTAGASRSGKAVRSVTVVAGQHAAIILVLLPSL